MTKHSGIIAIHGLMVKEPFVSGVPDMINYLVRKIPDAQEGFRMFFSKNKYSRYSQSVSQRRAESNGNWE